jgi:hypothetical protein
VPEAMRGPRGLPDPDSSGRPTFFRFGALPDIGASGRRTAQELVESHAELGSGLLR